MAMGTVSKSMQWISAWLIAAIASSPSSAADPKKQAYCGTYAQRAVEQYQLMRSHPQCQVPDDLNWHGSLDGHYNGCMLIPEGMSRAGTAGRDNHLLACGGMSPPSSPPDAAASAAAGSLAASGGAPGGAAVVPAATDATYAGVRPLKVQGPPLPWPQCKKLPAAPMLDTHPDGFGTGAKLHGIEFSYTDTQTKQIPNYLVGRPFFLAQEIGCKNMAGDTGLWMWSSPDRSRGYLFDVSADGRVTRSPLNAAQIRELLPP